MLSLRRLETSLLYYLCAGTGRNAVQEENFYEANSRNNSYFKNDEFLMRKMLIGI
jgi:hypothetical protein